MTSSNPVHFDVLAPGAFCDRAQLALRLVVCALLGMVGLSFGALALLVYLTLPVAAALLSSRDGPVAFARRDAPVLEQWLTWIMAASAYFGLVTERFPVDRPGDFVDFAVSPRAAAKPTVGSALLRLVKTLPAAIVLAVLFFVAGFVWVIAALCILVQRRYPDGLRAYLLGVLRYQARLLAYHASLVDAYPPFELATHEPTAAVS